MLAALQADLHPHAHASGLCFGAFLQGGLENPELASRLHRVRTALRIS